MKIALVHTPAIRSLEEQGVPELILPPIGISSLSAYLALNGYTAELYDLLLELDTTVIAEEVREPLLHLFDLARSDRAYDPAVMSNLGFYLWLNRNHLFREVQRLHEDLQLGTSTNRGSFARPIGQFFLSRARELAAYDVVGLSVIFDEQQLPALILARCIRSLSPGTKIVVGGTGARPEHWKHLADLVVRGEGEAELLAYLRAAPSIPRGAAVHYHADLDDLPAPDYAPLFRKYRYLAPARIIPLAITRGCYWSRCLFCSFGWQDKDAGACTAPYRRRSAKRVVDDIARLSTQHGAKTFFFSVDVVDHRLLEEISEHLVEAASPITWSTSARAEKPLLKPGLLRKLRRSGCRSFSCGYESFNQRVLDSMRKGTRVEHARSLLRQLRREGIFTNIGCFIGFPGETPREAYETHEVVSSFYQDVPGHVPDKFQLVEDSPAARLGQEGAWKPLRYRRRGGAWIKRGMSWGAQDRQWLIFATNFYCDSKSSCFPMRSEGGYALLYASRYPLRTLAKMFRDDDRSFGVLGLGRLTFYGFSHTLHYCHELGARFDDAKFLAALPPAPKRRPNRKPSKVERLDFAHEVVRAFVTAHELAPADRRFLLEVARFDHALLRSTLSGDGTPLVKVDAGGELARRPLHGGTARLLDFTVDVEAFARFEPHARIAKDVDRRVRFDLHGFHVM